MRRLLLCLVAAAALWGAPGALAAGSGWCGSGETSANRPDLVAGAHVHAIYAIPSDGADRFGDVANRLADDAAAIDAWWRGQDAQRELRFDAALFGACAGLDVSFIRLERTSSAVLGSANQYTAISSEIERTFSREYTINLVYFDGPSLAGICGTSSGGLNEKSTHTAIVWLQGCAGVETAVIAAHELIHALGALPAGAPHACSARDTGHPCDSERDILWPRVTGLSLAQEVLDVNRDDYYGHTGSWGDLQDSFWLHRVDLPQIPLAVDFSGNGRVTSDVPGVDCTAACTTQWDPATTVTLEAAAAVGTRFVRWTGACTGLSACVVRLDAARSVTAVFGPLRVPVKVGVTGRGSVACSPRCSQSFRAGDALRLTAKPAKGWRFAGWSGACRGPRPACTPATDFAVSARATFRKR